MACFVDIDDAVDGGVDSAVPAGFVCVFLAAGEDFEVSFVGPFDFQGNRDVPLAMWCHWVFVCVFQGEVPFDCDWLAVTSVANQRDLSAIY